MLTRSPVTPDASPEAVALLEFLYKISGTKTLAGQHCNPLLGSIRLGSVQKATGRYPALFGQDFGFSEPGTWDGINFRQNIVDEAIRRHHEGFIITLMWHAVRPTEDEPVDFAQSIQGKLTDAEWRELITPGTRINERWKAQVDVIAWHLMQLRHARVPVLWRPYHEMNGGWFWWGHQRGDDGYRKLYRMLFDRLARFHKLNNLIWVYNASELKLNVDSYETCFPSHDVVDVLATDVYRTGFAQRDYDELLALAEGKPIALGEVGALPSPQVLKSQPRWTWFMAWSEPGTGGGASPAATTSPDAPPRHASIGEVYESAQTLKWDELPWVTVKRPMVHHPVIK
jgi:mannan endo-1,4-beta-mannosidase